MHDEPIIRLKQVVFRVGLSRSTIYEMIAKGRFPRPTKLGKRAVGWRASVIDSWLEADYFTRLEISRRNTDRKNGGHGDEA
ncbi:AlpA family phage regulatory protein [Sphingosinithalassobacter portus]|uniref:AlpA family phage regulatory protein n=1 Tax=Stakelama portus TaxID=2676234 RepID=UPI000D6EA0D0